MSIAVTALLALLGPHDPAPAPAPAVRWSLRVDPAHCRLERQEAGGSAVSIDTTPGSDSHRLTIASPVIAGNAMVAPARVTGAPSGASVSGRASVVRPTAGLPVIWMQGLPPVLLDRLAGATYVTIATGQGASGGIVVPDSAKAIAALRRCETDQLVDWGADPAQFTAGGIAPTALVERDRWISNDVLLVLAAKATRASIDDAFRVAVAADGIVNDCRALSTTTQPDVERLVCGAVSARRLFAPAKDAAGDAVRGAATFRVALVLQRS